MPLESSISPVYTNLRVSSEQDDFDLERRVEASFFVVNHDDLAAILCIPSIFPNINLQSR